LPEKRQSEQYVKDMKRSACSISATSLGLRGISDIIAFEGATQVPYAERRALALQGMIFLPGFDAETEIHWRVSKETVRRRAAATVDMLIAGSGRIAGRSSSSELSELVELRRTLLRR
jgi:hypothetical protein